jgi:hypothetical protein
MNSSRLLLLSASLLAACAGDNHVTVQNEREPARYAPVTSAGREINDPNKPPSKYAPNRVYLITRLETADQPRGEWRTQGDTINEDGSSIEFTELGSGKIVSFTAPHQVTPMDSRASRSSVTQEAPGSGRSSSPNLYP